jgi:exodeoxyribonuclease-3
MRPISTNVNGIRAAARRGGVAWLAEHRPDLLCLQEVRASDDQLAEALVEGGFGGWRVAHTEAPAKGRAGGRGLV